jgi:hypothetical protein
LLSSVETPAFGISQIVGFAAGMFDAAPIF